MRVYVDSSALLKRVIAEQESTALLNFLDHHYQQDDLLVTSALGWVEVSRAVLRATPSTIAAGDLIDEAMSGIDEHSLSPDVISVARRLQPHELRSLDAIHLASAVVLDADVVVTYDERLADACRRNSLSVATPGRG
ncbi:type II toxin-antitoxin system VapC family toxin [Kribbella sandramycini]|uniref:Ribonuclease VapC n=1 Tax=Kribbella sandramycini TaxID=60450 RepID=A0A7Y4KZE0_9ACTN|nr:type II toxin-antitoxin system VapC family toxin [Kribbella sandramycini]MBB6565204.1 putative nucleic acid-binding protein [Kribbella sandramycini]NOL41473.1 type II toxin-antitoxin system VapC family toxin [Kribbella sandramycini]